MKILFALFFILHSFVFGNALLDLLKTDNHFAMIRHAYAPGVGDPDNFNINIRETQRNLNNTGIAQAKNIGKLFKKNGINEGEVYTSFWFRCYETAKYLDLGKVVKHEGLNSFFEDHYDEKTTSKILKDWLKDKKINKPLILVTHQVNITNLTNKYANSGEIVIVKRLENNSYKVVGTIPTLR